MSESTHSSENNSEITLDDCWNRIGVWGSEQPRCEKLTNYIHCHNCEFYADAGRRILERRIPDTYESTWANIYAQEKEEQVTGTESITIFRLGSEWMALPTRTIKEITEIQTIHSIPHRENPVLRGLVNLRGQLHICVSLGHLLGIEKAEKISNTASSRIYNRMLNIGTDTEDFVFVVSEVKETYRVDPMTLSPAPSTITKAKGSFTRGIIKWNDNDIAYLDSELLFYSLGNNLL